MYKDILLPVGFSEAVLFLGLLLFLYMVVVNGEKNGKQNLNK